MSAQILGGAILQFLDDDGSPLAGGLLWTYEAGLIVPQPLYTDPDLTIAFTNPIVLDAAGRPSGPSGPNALYMLASPEYGLILQRDDGSEVWSEDNIPAPGSGGGSGSGDSVVGSSSVTVAAVSPGVVSVSVAARGITFGMLPAVAASRLLGRGSAAGAGDAQELTAGAGLTIVGTALSSLIIPFSVALTNAQILALPTTPITIIAAAGAGFRVEIIAAYISLNLAGGYASLDPAGYIGLFYGNVASGVFAASVVGDDPTILDGAGLPVAALTAFLTTVGRKTARLIPAAYADSFNTSFGLLAYSDDSVGLDNVAVVLDATNSTNFTAGNGANAGVVGGLYRVVAVP